MTRIIFGGSVIPRHNYLINRQFWHYNVSKCRLGTHIKILAGWKLEETLRQLFSSHIITLPTFCQTRYIYAAKSPDVAIMENLWTWMVTESKKHPVPQSEAELVAFLAGIRTHIPQDYIRRLIDSPWAESSWIFETISQIFQIFEKQFLKYFKYLNIFKYFKYLDC